MTVFAPRPLTVLLAVALATAAGACGRAGSSADHGLPQRPRIGVKGTADNAAADLGFPVFATKNTTRVAGADAVADAAAVAQIVRPGTSARSRPAAVTLVDAGDWRAALAAASLYHDPIGAPILYATGARLPGATTRALLALAPAGSKATGGAQVIRVGTAARPGTLRTTDISGANPFALARSIDAFASAARRSTSRRVLLVTADDPAFAAPAAAWAAKSGDPVLFTHRNSVPPDTIAAIKAHAKPRIYILGPSRVITPKVTRQLKGLGRITRLGGPDPVANSIEFARFADHGFGWGIVDPGHGMVFVPQDADPTVAAAAAPLSASGAYGPALLLSSAATVDAAVTAFLLDIQPGYAKDPVRGVYNRAWLVGDTTALSPDLQAQIDRDLEIRSIAPKRSRR